MSVIDLPPARQFGPSLPGLPGFTRHLATMDDVSRAMVVLVNVESEGYRLSPQQIEAAEEIIARLQSVIEVSR